MVFNIHRQPNWTDIINKPSGDTPQNNGVQRNATGLTEGGLSAYPAALPSTPPAISAYDTAQQTAVIIDIHSPSTKSRAASERDVTTVREKIFLPILPLKGFYSLLSLLLALKVEQPTKVKWISDLGHPSLECPKGPVQQRKALYIRPYLKAEWVMAILIPIE